MFCPKCRKENPAKNKFCNKCGTSMVVEFIPPPTVSFNSQPWINHGVQSQPANILNGTSAPPNFLEDDQKTYLPSEALITDNRSNNDQLNLQINAEKLTEYNDTKNPIPKPEIVFENNTKNELGNIVFAENELDKLLDGLTASKNGASSRETLEPSIKEQSTNLEDSRILPATGVTKNNLYPILPNDSQPRGKKTVFVIGGLAAACLVFLMTFLGLIWILGSKGNSITQNTELKPVTEPANSNTNPSSTAPAGMAYVPGGDFMMGNENGDRFERPVKKTTVSPFYIDIYEVTCSDYKKFIDATNHRPPQNWQNREIPAGWQKRPVTGVNWDDANAYAKWVGKRLPTEAEWEFAARGKDDRVYPWGREWQENMANANGINKEMKDVGSYQGKSPFGLFDMVGNAWEWTADDARFYEDGRSIKSVTETLSPKVIRGGYYENPKDKATATVRAFWGARDENTYQNVGFRCVRN